MTCRTLSRAIWKASAEKTIVCLTISAMSTFGCLLAAQESSGTSTASMSLTYVRNGTFGRADFEIIGDAHLVEAIPLLERTFDSEQDAVTRGTIAECLVRLGAKNSRYYDYLVDLARPAIEGNIPKLYTIGPDGNMSRSFSPAFSAWAKANHMTEQMAAEEVVINKPIEVLLLAGADDSRSIQLLRKGLQSPSFFIQVAAARGLADLNDTASISGIIADCEKAPGDGVEALASPLVFFDDPRAQRTAQRYVSAVRIDSLLATKARGGTAIHQHDSTR